MLLFTAEHYLCPCTRECSRPTYYTLCLHCHCIRHTSGISGGFRQLRIYDSAVMANFGTFVMLPKEDTARDKLIPRKLVKQSRGDTKDEDVICHHSAHCRQILSIKTPLSSPSNSRIIWHVAAVACVCVNLCVLFTFVWRQIALFPIWRPDLYGRDMMSICWGGGGECCHWRLIGTTGRLPRIITHTYNVLTGCRTFRRQDVS